jgi:hypothetical protein
MKKLTNCLRLEIIFLLMVFFFQIAPAMAQNEGADSLVSVRLQFLKTTIEHDKVHTRQWWYGWLGLYSAATIGQGAIYFTSNNKSLRQDMALGAATTLLGAAGQFISPLIPDKKVHQFNMIPENTSDEKRKKLKRAEKLLKECIQKEKEARNWQNHAMTSAVNLGGGLITWLGFKRTVWDGVLNFAINEAVTEIQIFTSPTFAKRNYKRYCQKYLLHENSLSFEPEVNWYFNVYPGGVGVKIVF